MDVPSWWEFTLLALAAYRLTRLAGWDDFPLAAKTRAWLIGERWVPAEPAAGELGLPGKQPSSEVAEVRPAYDRPTLAHLVHCPFCVGFWISLAVYLCWQAWPHGTLIVLAPFAISGVVGLVAKQLDP